MEENCCGDSDDEFVKLDDSDEEVLKVEEVSDNFHDNQIQEIRPDSPKKDDWKFISQDDCL